MSTKVDTAKVPILPFNLPHSTLLDAVQDYRVQQLLEEEAALRAKRAQLRDELRQVSSKIDTHMSEQRPKSENEYAQFSGMIDQLQREKERWHVILADARAQQADISEAKEAVRGAAYDLSVVNRELNDAEMLWRDEQRELDRLLSMSVARSKVEAQQERVDRYRTTLQSKQAAQKELEKHIHAARAKLDAAQGGESAAEREERFREAKKNIAEIRAKLTELKAQRQASRKEELRDPFKGEQSAIRHELQDIDSRLDEIRVSELQPRHFTYPIALRTEIVGRGGATLRQLQYDFGVAICVDNVDNGHGFIIGGEDDCAACAKAIQCIVDGAGRQTAAEVVPFAPGLKRQIIGTKGSTIDAFQRDSGAKLDVRDHEVHINGSASSVALATTLLRQFLDGFTTESMAVPPKMLNVVIGKGGSTIKEVEKMSGVRSLQVDKHSGRIVATGTSGAVAAALQQYRNLLGEAEGGTCVVHGDDLLMRAVVGPKGSTVRAIEEATGARVSCEGTAVTITGPPDAVEAARVRVEAMRRAERRVAVKPAVIGFLGAEVVLERDDAPEDARVYMTPLEAMRRSAGCDQLVLLRHESCVVIRGRPANVSHAATLLGQLLLWNTVHQLRVSHAQVLQGALLRRQASGETLLDQVQKGYSAMLRIDLDRDQHALLVSSVDAEEARAAASELAQLLGKMTREFVRVIPNVPMYRISQLIGTKGAVIRQLQEDTGTEISVCKEREQVQVFCADGDEEKLAAAVCAVRAILEMDTGEAEGEEVGEVPSDGITDTTV
ncbi:hypothetical protein STCU_05469 [Strigomonas culicis]|uniref:K Homology domain-containing protein n=1 Tax=Strigomonas culicis TaxID=28005 RepID=S9UGJ0_9TRYP|nr:hypothetical protein STCU_05469 [Strigomonas culicis]|eukprot:EPY27869.1 hypothetical protein STCU_05469 [Strigomonas culicis]